ncbi:oxidoreductase family protein [Paraburkholderia sp. BL23I1N1]|uniref:oxidoreductase-like domain-containing protein n=1 Tax=Paraburkholderia sp. BL23I1N1 TaxID=1938802 RepID=UPI000E757BE1|nr:oxidoreductase-like domain-containing protein [Paraburkholderia sp. BL23I1N1]RKE38126.1 oxidoreductase family protein [Paraburkholderia sp. BL23I1N1]
MPRASLKDDPQPVPPVQPELEDCCHSGCNPCVFDLYDEAFERYQQALAEWQARQAIRTAPTVRTPQSKSRTRR